jgi:hypothetical protein
VSNIDDRDSENRYHLLNLRQLRQEKDGGAKGIAGVNFKWVTNMELKAGDAARIAQEAGRIRCKIENEAFNVQKNGGCGL